ncbi:MAG: Bud site selection protein 6 [Trichoglossum hirsutum]|nr:MAG: Bud site selection protein 6 [Trichoglossum hirsutum]
MSTIANIPHHKSGQQLSQIEKSVTHLLVATKQLLETLTQWSRQTATEAEVSDVYVRLGYEFNIACRAFTAIGVETADLGNVPDALRSVLEETLSQEASPKSLDQYLPHIRDIIINLLHGLKRKQQKLREKQAREAIQSNGMSVSRNDSMGSVGSAGSGLTQMLDDIPSQYPSGGTSQSVGRGASKESLSTVDEPGIPPRSSSVAGGGSSPPRQERSQSKNSYYSGRGPPSNRDTSSTQQSHHNTPPSMQNTPIPTPQLQEPIPSKYQAPSQDAPQFPPPPPPPPKQQDALMALQRGGDLERRASRRYSAYQISKHFGVSPTGVPTIPSSQNTPVPNRGRDARESMNAVRIRGSLLHSRQKSANRLATESPSNNDNTLSSRISEESFQSSTSPAIQSSEESQVDGSSAAKSPEKRPRPSEASLASGETSTVGSTINGGLAGSVYATYPHDGDAYAGEQVPQKRPPEEDPAFERRSHENQSTTASSSPRQSRQFVPEQSPEPGKELTLFLQYKSKIKKFVLPDGLNELSIARLQLAFIEKFAWNTHSNGNDLPEIYIQDPVSGVRHELEDLSDVKDRSVLVLNVEVLDEVKRHIDEGLGGLKRMVEGVRNVVDGQQSMIQRVSDRQQEVAKEVALLTVEPVRTPNGQSQAGVSGPNGTRTPSSAASSDAQLNEIKILRRDLAVMRQTYSSFVSDIEASMSTIRQKASSVKTVAINAVIPELSGESGRTYVNAGKKTLGDDSDRLVARVDDLQDIVEDLRKDVVTRGVRPIPRQLEEVGRDISLATAELKKMQEYLKREKPIWTKIWEKELELVCTDRDLLTMQEELAADLEDDLEKAAQTFALVEQCTKEQMKDGQGNTPRAVSRGLSAIPLDTTIDPRMAKEGVLGEVRALQPNHENRLEAIERAEKLRQKELESRRGGEFQKELGSFVEEGKLKKSGGVEEAERLRKAKDDRIRKEVWERQNARAQAKEAGSSSPTKVTEDAQSSRGTFLEEPDLSPIGVEGSSM